MISYVFELKAQERDNIDLNVNFISIQCWVCVQCISSSINPQNPMHCLTEFPQSPNHILPCGDLYTTQKCVTTHIL